VLVISKLRMQERQWNPADSRYQDQVNTRLAGGKGQPSIPVPGTGEGMHIMIDAFGQPKRAALWTVTGFRTFSPGRRGNEWFRQSA